MSDSQNLQFLIGRIKARLKRQSGDGSFEMASASEALFVHLQKSNELDGMGVTVMRLGCRLAIIETSGRGVSSRMGPLPSQAEALLRSNQMHFSDFDADWLDEEIAISDGPQARRKERGECRLAELKASISIRDKHIASVQDGRDRDQAVIDANPAWERNPNWTLNFVLGISGGSSAA